MDFISSEDLVIEIGQRIKSELKRRGLTIQDLAYLIDIERPNLSNLINGNIEYPTVWTYYRIAKGLEMSLSELFDLKGNDEEE